MSLTYSYALKIGPPLLNMANSCLACHPLACQVGLLIKLALLCIPVVDLLSRIDLAKLLKFVLPRLVQK